MVLWPWIEARDDQMEMPVVTGTSVAIIMIVRTTIGTQNVMSEGPSVKLHLMLTSSSSDDSQLHEPKQTGSKDWQMASPAEREGKTVLATQNRFIKW